MSKLYFKVASDWQEVVRLRDEISKLETQIKSMDANKAPQAVAVLNHQMQQTKQQMQGMITEAAKAGAAMDNDFKSKIYQSSQSVNDFTQKIINQKAVVKDVEADVKRLGESYRSALKNNPLSASSKLSEYTSAKKALDEEKAALFGLTQEQANARLSVKKLRDEYSRYKDEGKGVVSTTDGIGISLKKAFAVIGGVAVIKQLGSEIIRVRGEFQSMQTAIETLVGKDMASNLIPQIKELAKTSPLTLTDMVGAEKMMLGFNINAEDTIRYLQALGDISMGNSQKFNSLTLAFSQMSATGKLMGQDLNQMINAGFNPLQQIAQSTGKSIATLKEEMSKGAISTEMVQKAFIDATSAGGKFFGMSENASKTINGQLSMMQDALDEVFNELGTKGEGVIMAGIQASTSLIQNYETVGKVLSGLVVTYGGYRTAVMLSTIATGKHTIAEVALTNVRVIARRAQMALNASMLTNPYVLLATVVVGAAAAMWAFHDGTTAAEKAQDSYNKKVEDAAQKAQDHKQKLEGLISELQNEVTAETRKMEILDEIKKGYPSLFQKFIDEKGHIKDLTEAWKAYNEEASKNKAIQNRSNASGTKKNLQEYRKMVSLWDKYGEDPNFHKNELSVEEATLASKYSNETLGRLKKKIEVGERELSLYEKDVREDNFNQWKVDLKGKTDEQIKAIREAMVNRSKAAKGDKNLLSALGKRIIAIDEEKNNRKASSVTYGADFRDAKIEWETAKKELDAIEKDKDNFTVKQYDNAKKREETAEKAYKDLGGVTGSSLTKQESAAEKLRKQNDKLKELSSKQSIEQSRAEEDLQNQLAQSRINAMANGFEKVQAQREFDNKKEIQAIERQKDDYIRAYIQAQKELFNAEEDLKAQKDKSYKKRTFDSSSVSVNTSGFDTIISNTKTKQSNDSIAQQESDWNEFIIKYGTFLQKRQAITEKYNKLINESDTSGKAALLQKEMEEALSGLSVDKLKKEINWEVVFGDMSKIAKKQLQEVKKQLQEFKKSPEFKNSTPEQIKVIEEALDKINSALVDKSGFFGGLGDSLADYKLKLEEAKKAQEEYDEALKTGNQALIEKATETRNTANANVTNSGTNVEKSGDKAVKNINAVSSAIIQLGKKDVSLTDIGSAVGALVDTLGKSGSMIGGIISAILSIIDAAGDIGTIQYGMNLVGNVTTKVTDAFARDTEAITGIDMSFMRGADYDDYNELKEQYETISSIWNELIDKKTEYLEIGTTEERKRTEGEILDLIGKQEQAYRNLGLERLNAGSSAGSHSIGVRIKKGMSDEGWEQVKSALGEELYSQINDGRMEKLFSLSSEQLENLKGNAPDFWAKLDDDVRKYLEDIIKCGEQTEETIKKAEELWAGMSFDSLVDNFKSALSDMDSSTADFADDFQQYMIKAMIDSFVNGEIFQKKLKDWHKKLAEYSESDKKITEEEKDSLKNDWDALVQEGLDYRNNLFESMGFSNSSSTSQDSTSGGFETMSQDTGEELNGRFTALQIAGEEIRNQSILQSQSLNLLTFKADAILTVNTEVRNIADETRTILANSYLELKQISENTGESAKYLKEIKTDIADVKRNTSRI